MEKNCRAGARWGGGRPVLVQDGEIIDPMRRRRVRGLCHRVLQVRRIARDGPRRDRHRRPSAAVERQERLVHEVVIAVERGIGVVPSVILEYPGPQRFFILLVRSGLACTLELLRQTSSARFLNGIRVTPLAGRIDFAVPKICH
jgi:hypothetical protein